MAEDKDKTPLLMNELTIADCAMLAQTMSTPGFEILVRLNEAVCVNAQKDTFKLDPEGPDYERKLSVRTQRARNVNEAIEHVRLSALAHIKRLTMKKQQEDVEAKNAVASVFGIHPAVPNTEGDAIKKTFGIHAAKPKKSK